MLSTYMKSLGYNDKEIDIIRKAYVLRNYNEIGLYNKISDIFNYLISFGYNDDDTIKMTIKFPTIYSFSLDMIKKRIDDLMAFGWTKEEIIKMTKKMPNLFGRSIDDIRIKKKFYDRIGVGDIIVRDPIHFSQSIELSYARYIFYHRMGIKIDRGNANMLFMKQEIFINRFGKTNEQLIKMYNYQELLERNKFKSRKK